MEDINKNPDIKDEDIIIPEGVVDEDIYREYKKRYNKWKYSKETEETISIIKADNTKEDLKIDFASPTFLFNKLLNKILDENLKKRLLEKRKEYDIERGHLMILKNKAFGIFKSPKSESIRDSILDVRKTEILELFGKFYNLTEVHRILINEYKLETNFVSLENFRVKHLDQIKELQEEYVRDYSDIRLTHKKSRLEELNELFIGRKNIYNTTKKGEDYKLLLQTIEQIKREVEGDIVTINGNINLNIEQTLTSHIYQELIKGLAIKEIILSRVAARTNTNPYYLLSRLIHSYYSKFNGFDDTQEINEDIEINLYPSQLIYNFDEIKNLNELKKQERRELQKLDNIEEVKFEEISDIKKDLINRIKSNSLRLEEEKNNLDKINKKEEK